MSGEIHRNTVHVILITSISMNFSRHSCYVPVLFMLMHFFFQNKQIFIVSIQNKILINNQIVKHFGSQRPHILWGLILIQIVKVINCLQM